MRKIEDLTYAFNLGQVSRAYCNSLLIPYIKQANTSLDSLYEWHCHYCNMFGIDANLARKKRKGFNNLVMSIPSIFNKDLRYKKISGNTAAMIQEQSNYYDDSLDDDEADLFREDVRLIAMDGKLYYLPENS